MKPLQGDSVNINSCTCTSCDSKSESDRQTLKRLLNQGSKINKLLTGKYYAHLRESDLLDKLIKTRALYDSLRSQLLSSSESSSAELQSQQSSREIRKAFVEANKNSDIFALLDLEDKGAVMGLRKLSECCSCCTCSSKFRLHENVQKGRRNRQAYPGGIIASRSSFASKQETGEAKNIKSDPCTCACFKKEKNMKSKELVEKVRPRKSIIERDCLPATRNNLKLSFQKNCKLEKRKSYHQLKRVKACPSPYMENIGEGGNKALRKSKLVTHTIERTISIELLEKKIKDSFETDRKALRMKEPVGSSIVKENMSRANKTTITKLKDQVDGKRQTQSSAHKSRKNNQALAENTHISEISNTSSTSTLKGIPLIKGNERKEMLSQGEKHNKMHTLAETNADISDKLRVNEESHALKGSNQVQNSKTIKLPPQKDTADVVEKHKKLLPFSSTPGKELSIPNTATIPDNQNTESINSIKKSHPTQQKKLSSNSFNKINKANFKTRSFVSFRKRLILLSGPLRFRPRHQISEEPRQLEEPARHKKPHYSEELCPCEQCLQKSARLRKEPARRKKPSEVKQKNNKSGSHGLKRCLCSIKFKINETKCRISKNVTNDNLKVKDKQIIHSKSLLSAEKSFKIANDDLEHMSDHVIKCESSDYVKQNQAIRKIQLATQNETNALVEIKCVDETQTIEHNLSQDISTTPQLSIHALISDCVCKEVEQFMCKHYGQQNIKFGAKSTFNHFSNKPKEKSKMQDERRCFDENIVNEEMGRIRIKSTLKDASITTEKPRKLQNQSVQTVMKLKQQEKKNTCACNPRFSKQLNKGYFNNGLKITQSKVKYNGGEGTKRLPNKQSQKSKKTTAKHGLRRCFCTLQLDKQENKIKSQRKVSKVTMIQPKSQVKGYQTEVKLGRHAILPYEYDLTISSSKKCFSRQLKIELIKRKERKPKKHITSMVRKSRSYSNLNSRSLQISKTQNIDSIVISHNSDMLTTILKRNQIKSPDISMQICNSKRSSCLCSPIDKDNKIQENTVICSLRDIKLKNDMKDLQKIMLFENTTKEDQSLLLDLTNKRCLPILKLRKKRKYNKKSSLVNTDIKSNIIIIADKIMPGFHKGAKFPESKYSNQLSICRCNPDEYLGKNKRNRTLKQFGKLTKKNKNKSKSSDIHKLRSKLLFVKSNFQQRNPSLQRFKKMRINSRSSYLPQLNDNFLKQGVKIGSNFSFDINFYKGVTAENNFYQNRTKNMNVHFLNSIQGSNLPTKIYSTNRINQSTNKVSLEPNKCFCTLKISKTEEQRRNNKMLSPFVTKKLTQVYAMSTVAMAMPEDKIKTPESLKGDHDCHCIDFYHPTRYLKNASNDFKQWKFNKNPTCGFSLSMIAFNAKNIQSCIRKSKYKLLQISSAEQSLFDFASNEAIRFESAFSCEMDDLKNICKKERKGSAQSQNDSRLPSQHNPPSNPSLLTGAQTLLRRCYCTMNIQVAHQKRKLLDYECEPGICIPGECDPYECQKLIMKRLMRKVSRMSGTDSRSRSSASGTSSTSSRSKRLQSGVAREPKYRTRGHGARLKSAPPPQGLKYQTLPRGSAPGRKQAVKVSSSFSFDIEFSKDVTKATAAPTTETVVRVPKRHTFSRSSRTYHKRGMDRGTKYSRGRHHRETQSMMKQMRHRASSVTPMLKRCFCTLKLQKKGRQQKELELRSITQGTSTPPKFGDEGSVFSTSEKGQNTKRKHKCGPTCDECDPSDCLELIRKRHKYTKDFGTDSMVSSTSSSSMTSSQKRKMKRIQARNIRPKQFRSSYTSVRSKPSVMSIDTVNRQRQDRQVAKPSRQAVKIGSTLSFNIEFYKDKISPYNYSDSQPPEVYVHKAPKEVKKVPKNVYAQRRMREGSSQSGTSSRDDDSQIGIFQRGQSTMTSGFLKRNAKLHGYNVDAATGARRPPSKLKRCFCTLKLLSGSKRRRINDGGVGHERATSVAMTQTRRVRGQPQTKGRYSDLLPYECEPGVCEPGYCDPYECIKLIRKRLAKEKMTGTEGPRTRSISSYFTSSNPSRARMTQYRSAWPKTKMTQLRPGRRRGRGRRRDYASRESVLHEKVVIPVPPQRQAVRIGSNFSFNIEFYKDKSPNNLDVQVAAPVIKTYRPVSMRDRGHGAYRRVRTRDRGLRGRRYPSISRDSQMDRIRSRDIGLGPMLRRCFCTLKLQKKTKGKAVSKAEIKAVSKSEIKAKSESKTIQKQTDSKTQKNTIPNLNCLCNKSNKNKCICDQPYKKKKCTCDQPNKKNKCICDQPNKKNECTCTGPIKKVATLHNKSVVASKKTKDSIGGLEKTKKSTVAVIKPKRNIMKRRQAFPYKLEPYECEPGICVPGECDPWECLKRINKRLMYSSGTSTDPRGTRSTSNMAVSTYRDSEAQSYIGRKKQMRTRDTYTRFRSAWPKTKMTQARSARRRVRRRRRNYALSDSILQEKFMRPASPQRQAVKIGSNFNFSVEFYKNKSPKNLEVQVASPVVKRYQPVSKRDRGHGAYRRVRTRDRGLRGRRFPSISRDSQMDRIRSRDIGLGPMLRRCFCTLKLQKKTKAKAVSKTEIKAVSKAEIKAETEPKTIEKEIDSQPQKNTIPNLKCLCDKANKNKCSCDQPNKKNKCSCDQPNKKNECTCTPSIKEVATLHNKSITTLKKTKESIVAPEGMKESIVASKKTKESIVVAIKPKRNIMKRRKSFPYKLEPYECEPGICVPGECDPYECLKLINKRLMYSSGTSTDPRGTRSTSNMAVSTYRDSEAQSYMHRKKQMKTRDSNTIYGEKRPYGERRSHRERRPHRERRLHRERRPHMARRPHRERRPHSETRPESRSSVFKDAKQAVKIGSTFNLEMEFSKDKLHSGPVVTSKPIKQYSKPKRTSSRATEGQSTSYRNKKAQRYRTNRDIYSQALGPSMRSAMTGTIGPFLKRCFCTLQLRCNTENHGSPFKCLYESQKLLPNECEPGFCVPGECDPYECLKRIKRRMQSKQVGTIFSNRSCSSSTCEGSKYRPRCIQTRSSTPRRRNVMTSRRSGKFQDDACIRSVSSSTDERKYRPRRKARSFSPRRRKVRRNDDQFQHDTSSYRQTGVKYDIKPKRQAVRIGSSFSFDIEFFKENSSKLTREPQVSDIVKKDERKRWSTRRRRMERPASTKSMSTNSMSSDDGYSFGKKRATRGTMKRSISTKSMSSYCKKYDPRDIESQSEVKKCYSKGIGTPMFRRCFCTLKLEKRGRLRQPKPKNKFSLNIIKACRRAPSFKSPSEKSEPSTKCVSTHTKSKSKFMKPSEYRRKKEVCKCPVTNTPALEPSEFPCKKGKKCKCCKCNTSREQDQRYTHTNLKTKSVFFFKRLASRVTRDRPPNEIPFTCKHSSFETTNEFPCKKGKQCKCCKCNTSRQQYQKCCKCNSHGLEPKVPVDDDTCRCKTQKPNKKYTKNKNCKCFESCECTAPPFPCKEGKECKCCKCNTSRQQYKKCCKCNSHGLEPKVPVDYDTCRCKTQTPNKKNTKNKNCKCFESCECVAPSFPCKEGTNCKCCKCNSSRRRYQKCCKCNSPGQEPKVPVNHDKCRCKTQKPNKKNTKSKNCKCFESCECVSPPFPCKEGKECKCCICNTCFTITNEYQGKKNEVYKSPVGNTEQKINPVDKFKGKTQKLNKNKKSCRCFESCECKTSDKKTSTETKNRSPDKRMKRRQRMSASSMAATFVPGYTHKRIKYKGEPYYPDKIERIVEEPRFPFLQGKDARQGVKISSNFSFNVEFFKEMLPPAMNTDNEIDERGESPPSHQKKPIKEIHRGTDTGIGRHCKRDDYNYSNDSQSEPYEMLRKCFCQTKLQKGNYAESMSVNSRQERRPRSLFGPDEYLVHYQIQQPTRKYFKSNPQELETIMSYAASKSNNIFGRMDPTKQGTQGIPKYSDTKKYTVKNMLMYCKTLFTKLFNKHNTKKPEVWTEIKKGATNKHPLIDILKVSKSERHPNKVTTADIKKSKSLKVTKVSEKNDYKTKYSRYQSGDHHGSKPQYKGIKFVKKNCKHCQNKFKETIPIHDMIRFTTLRTAKALNSKPNDAIVTGRKNDPESVSFMSKSPKFNNSLDVHLKVCSFCGGIQRIKKKSFASNFLNTKDKILEGSEDTTVTPKGLNAIPTKIDMPENATTLLPQENKQDCRCCACKSISKSKTLKRQNSAFNVCGNGVWKNELERHAETVYHAECIINKRDKCFFGPTICPAKSEKNALATRSGCKLAPNKKERYSKPLQEAKLKEVIDKNINEKGVSKKVAKYKNTPGALLVESVLDNEVGFTSTVEILRNLHITVFDSKSESKKLQTAADNSFGVETLQRLKLKCQARKCVTERKEKFEDHLENDFAIHSNNTNRKKEFHAKKPAWQRHSRSVFDWSPFMLSLRKKPWLSAYYKCAGFFPHCLTILQVWRQFMDIILFILAVTAVSPCLLGVELCRALKSCFLCTI